MQLIHNAEVAYYLRLVFICISLVHNIIIFIYHCYKIWKSRSRKFKVSYMQKLSIFTLSMILIYSLQETLSLVGSLTGSCKFSLIRSVWLYMAQKFTYYLFCMERLFAIFKRDFSNTFKISVRSILVILVLIYLIIVILNVDGKQSPHFGGLGCVSEVPLWIYNGTTS